MEEHEILGFTYDDMLSQLREMPFGRTPFTVYNFADEDGWVTQLSVLNKTCVYDFDDLETLKFTIPPDDVEYLKMNKRSVVDFYNEFKKQVEKEMQTVPNVGVFVIRDIGSVFAVKPKGYDISNIFS